MGEQEMYLVQYCLCLKCKKDN